MNDSGVLVGIGLWPKMGLTISEAIPAALLGSMHVRPRRHLAGAAQLRSCDFGRGPRGRWCRIYRRSAPEVVILANMSQLGVLTHRRNLHEVLLLLLLSFWWLLLLLLLSFWR